jgi:NAD(P)-dependent dehydrogenase (short-subunit alcohol dehydrogenase family)
MALPAAAEVTLATHRRTVMTMKPKVVFVTGAGRGIGKGIARCLLQAGARVFIAEQDADLARAATNELGAIGEVEAFVTDVSDEPSVHQAVAHCLSRFDRIDGLINNAGIADPHMGPIENLDLARWNRVLSVNLTGMMLCAKHCVPELRQRQGTIVNIASTRALQSEAQTEAYAASKGGIVALTHALAISLGPQVRVNCISPGWIHNGEVSSLRPIDHQQHPVGRVGVPDDIAQLALYLSGPEASFITGQNFVVDGGMTRKMIYAE